MSSRARSLVNIAIFVAVVFMNYIANALPLNGVTQKEISAGYESYITPAGYVFSIWGIIYLGLTFYIITQALPKWVDKQEIRSLDVPFILSCICNILWLIVWHYFYLTISVLMMFGLLSSLIGIYIRLEDGKRMEDSSFGMIATTFRIYVGWVGLATVLNLSIWFNALSLGDGFLSAQNSALLLLGIVCLIYLYLAFTRREIALIGVLAWASFGIGIKNQSTHII